MIELVYVGVAFPEIDRLPLFDLGPLLVIVSCAADTRSSLTQLNLSKRVNSMILSVTATHVPCTVISAFLA